MAIQFSGNSSSQPGFRELQYLDAMAMPYTKPHQTTYLEQQVADRDNSPTVFDWHKKGAIPFRHNMGRLLDGSGKVRFVGKHIADHYLRICEQQSEREANLYFQSLKTRLSLGDRPQPVYWFAENEGFVERFLALRFKELYQYSDLDDISRFYAVSAVCARYFNPVQAFDDFALRAFESCGDAYMPGAFYREVGPAIKRMVDLKFWHEQIKRIQEKTFDTTGYPKFWLLDDDESLERFVELRMKELQKSVTEHDFSRYFSVSAVCARYFAPYKAVSDSDLLNLDSRGDAYMPGALYRKVGPAVNRMTDAAWWFKQIKRIQKIELEQVCRETASVCKKRATYCSDWAFKEWEDNQEKNRQLLHNLMAVDASNDDNYASLLEMASRTVSNPELRRAELMTRIRGFEEVAQKQKDCGVFITLTCPSRFHATHKNGRPNKKFDGSTPLDAQAWLQERWARARALFKHYEIMPYGFRIAEPHHDGCPHWHGLFFLPTGQYEQFCESLKKSFLSDELEPGSEEHRLKIVRIDRSRGTAAGYIAKYVSKNIDGAFVGENHSSGANARDSAARVRSWASTWRIRQFQQIGGPSVSVWREMRRFREPFKSDDPMFAHLTEIERAGLEAVRRAADEGDWAAFCIAMGGVHVVRKDRTVSLSYSIPEAICKLTGEIGPRPTRYGDEPQKKIMGVLFKHIFMSTRFTEWEIMDRAEFIRATAKIMSGVTDVFDLLDKYEHFCEQLEEDYNRLEHLFYANQEQMWLEIDEYEAAEWLALAGDG